MSYDYGLNFGYDQIFVNPGETYTNASIKKLKNNDDFENELFSKMINTKIPDALRPHTLGETFNLQNSGPMIGMERLTKTHATQDNNNNYIPNILSHFYELQKKSFAEVRKTLDDLKYTNDMLSIFIVCLFIFIIMQFGSYRNSIDGLRYVMPVNTVASNTPLV